jgi:putative zinc finger/helix-turn-helix YgiT family protein
MSESVKNGRRTGKPFPWRCPECGKKEVRPVVIDRTSLVKHDGRMHAIEVRSLRVPQCAHCGELVFDNDADDQIGRALREHLGLLPAERIRHEREALGLSQRELAEHLGVAIETISRWENGVLTQTRSMDRYLRVYFGFPDVRAALADVPAVVCAGCTVPEEV